ncbi:hypothetical protein [Halosimplex salinum]|uniref:hypothetical protein n=1 Tax=Halosimplex salinum TaxID=1710538 RepID=UPI000F4AB8A1|nr:hypothetical protein [Halosimplex salinum]
MQETRRNVLKRGGVAIAGLSSLAGCLGGGDGTATEQPNGDGDGSGDGGGTGDGDGGGSTPTATDTATASGTATATPVASRPETPVSDLAKWMPDPESLDQTDASGYAFLAMAPRSLREHEGDLGADALADFDEEYPIPGVGTLGDLTAIYRFARSATVLVGEFGRKRVEDGFRDHGFEADDSRHGFRIFSTDDQRAVAVRDGMLVTAGAVSSWDDSDKRPVVEAVVDARTGNAAQYVDAVDDCARLLDAVGSAHVLQGRTHEAGETFEGGVGEGMGYHVGSDETRAHAAAVFADEGSDRSAMADWAGDSEAFLGSDPTVRADGRAVTATALVPTGEVTEFPGEFPGPNVSSDDTRPNAPTVSLSMDYEERGDGRGICTVSHEGGDSIDRSALSIRGKGFEDVEGADQTGAGPWQGSASGDGETVVAGDSVAVGVASDYVLSVVWTADDGETSSTLDHDEGPDA